MHQSSPTLCSILPPQSRSFLVLGVGSPLRSDDRVGLVFCDYLLEEGINCVKCEYGVENCMDIIANTKPETLIIVDAALFNGGKPGDVVIVSEDALADSVLPVSTHSMPLQLLLKVLKDHGDVKEIFIIGIYPKLLDVGEDLSREVLSAAKSLAREIKKCLEEERRERQRFCK